MSERTGRHGGDRRLWNAQESCGQDNGKGTPKASAGVKGVSLALAILLSWQLIVKWMELSLRRAPVPSHSTALGAPRLQRIHS